MWQEFSGQFLAQTPLGSDYESNTFQALQQLVNGSPNSHTTLEVLFHNLETDQYLLSHALQQVQQISEGQFLTFWNNSPSGSIIVLRLTNGRYRLFISNYTLVVNNGVDLVRLLQKMTEYRALLHYMVDRAVSMSVYTASFSIGYLAGLCLGMPVAFSVWSGLGRNEALLAWNSVGFLGGSIALQQILAYVVRVEIIDDLKKDE